MGLTATDAARSMGLPRSTIALKDWQQEIVDDHSGPFLRGLIHSDGCRMTNWTQRRVAGKLKRYEYPRYFFTNNQVSVARREAVAALDVWVGPTT